MIHYVHGNIFESDARILVNPVNTVGVMGKGLALQFKKRYPEMFKYYRALCYGNNFIVGKPVIVAEYDHDIMLFPTKENWRDPSNILYIEYGLLFVKNFLKSEHAQSIAFPKLGCGCGGLRWDDVKSLMEKYLTDIPSDIYIYI